MESSTLVIVKTHTLYESVRLFYIICPTPQCFLKVLFSLSEATKLAKSQVTKPGSRKTYKIYHVIQLMDVTWCIPATSRDQFGA